MSLLTVVVKFANRTSLPVPATVVGSTDAQIRQVMHLLEQECTELAARHGWTALTKECTFLTLAATLQGTLQSLGSGPSTTSGLRYVINNVMWNRSQQIKIIGPLDPQDWQALQAQNMDGFPQYRIRENNLYISPAPGAGETVAFEYVTNNWALSGVTPVSSFLTDADVFLLPESLITAGLQWRWKKEKGLSYAEDFNSYESMVQDAIGRDGTKRHLNMGTPTEEVGPKIFIPPGSWNL